MGLKFRLPVTWTKKSCFGYKDRGSKISSKSVATFYTSLLHSVLRVWRQWQCGSDLGLIPGIPVRLNPGYFEILGIFRKIPGFPGLIFQWLKWFFIDFTNKYTGITYDFSKPFSYMNRNLLKKIWIINRI